MPIRSTHHRASDRLAYIHVDTCPNGDPDGDPNLDPHSNLNAPTIRAIRRARALL